MAEFREFPKIARLNRDIVISEKIDGTNACVVIDELTGEVTAQSRNKVITVNDDNHGFANWVKRNEAELKNLLGPGYHFGEWWGTGINKQYSNHISEKRFSLFNVSRWTPENTAGTCVHVVPTLYKGPFSESAIQVSLNLLSRNGSVACPGAKAEGIVVFHTAAGTLFKVTLEGDESPKGLKTSG